VYDLRTRLGMLRKRVTFRGSADYWERHYRRGGDSGACSYGQNAAEKARAVNASVVEHAIESVIEFGCGDGNQLSLLRVDRYIGLDVSPTAVERCAQAFEDDRSKSFFLYSPAHFFDRTGIFRADASLSQDVIFHLVEDEVFERYMRQLFASAERYVLIWSSDLDWKTPGAWEVHRRFTPWVEENLREWRLVERQDTRQPWSTESRDGMLAGFFVYERAEEELEV
jgi:hypothetical protein